MLFFIISIAIVIIIIKKAAENGNITSGKISNQTNKPSMKIEMKNNYIEYLDNSHNDMNCKYSTDDPNFSFNGRPNVIDDFAELRKRNEKHERHLQKRIM